MNSFYGYKVIGIYQTPEQCAADPIAVANGLEPGDFIYEDVNGDHVIDGNDKQVLGSYVPSFTYGFNAGFSYKNFDFSLTTYGQAGGELWNRKRALRYAPTTITLTVHSMRPHGRCRLYQRTSVGQGSSQNLEQIRQ